MAAESEEQVHKKKVLEEKIRRRVAHEERAHKIVIKLLDNPVSREYLCDCAAHIAQDHYTDIVEERSIIKQCGLPICSNVLATIPKKKYHISLTSNKVYDITERKKYCSNQCFKISEHFKQQISVTPVWSRENEPPPDFEILPADTHGSSGEFLVGSTSSAKKEAEVLETTDQLLNTNVDSSNRAPCFDKPEDKEHISIDQPDDNISSGDEDHHYSTFSTFTEITDVNSVVDNEESNVSKDSVQSNIGKDSDVSEIIIPHAPASLPDDKARGNTNTNEGITLSKTEQMLKLLSKKKNLKSFIQLENVSTSDTSGSNEVEAQEPSVHHTDVRHKEGELVTEIQPVLENDKYLISADIQKIHLDSRKITSDIELKEGENVDRITSVTGDEKDKCSKKLVETAQSVKQEKPATKSDSHLKNVNNNSLVFLVCQAISSWMMPDSLKYLNQKVKLNKTDVSDDDFASRYAKICHKINSCQLDIDEVENSLESSSSTGQPVPSYDELKEQTDEFDVKVKEFLSGDETRKRVKKGESSREPMLPVVDAHSILSIRQNIVSEKLYQVIPQFLVPLKLTWDDLSVDVKKLIATFNFTNKNIVFKTSEWMVVGLVFLNLLRICNSKVHQAFEAEAAEKCLGIILAGLKFSQKELDITLADMVLIRS